MVFWNNNTYPTENHKYFDNYKSLVNKILNLTMLKYLSLGKNETLLIKLKITLPMFVLK